MFSQPFIMALQLGAGLGLVLILLACGEVFILRLARSDVSYGRCVLLTLAGAALSIGVFLALTLINPFRPGDQPARRASVYFPPVPALTRLTADSLPVMSARVFLSVITASSSASVPVHQALAYLQKQYDPQVGLLRESPTTAPYKYWLATDNLVAWYALRPTGSYTLTDEIAATFDRYGIPTHGLIEILNGQIKPWPPYVETQQQVATIGSAEVWIETRTAGAQDQDWAEYADLALYAALNVGNRGQSAEAHRLYRDAMQLFDGVGFADRAFRAAGVYTTYKLALAIYVAQVLSEPVDTRLWSSLYTKQASTSAPAAYIGGFYALYDRQGRPLNDPNTETTAYALLALSCGSPRCIYAWPR